MKYSKIVTFLLVAILFLACQTSGNKVKVGFLFSNFDIPRWGLERDIFTKRMNQLGGEVLVADAKSDAIVQYNQAMEFINQGVDVLVITVANANTAAAIVREAHKNNVKVIAYDGLIYNSDLDYLVGFDLERVGRLLGEYVTSQKPEGNYVIFNGDKAHAAAEEINNGLMEVLKPSIESKKVKIVYNGWMEGWSGVNSEFYTEKVLEFADEKIDVFVAANDDIASGIARELKRRNYTKRVIITGQDGELSACNRIINDKQSMSVYKSCKLIGNAAAELAYNIAVGKEPEITETRFNGRIEVPAIILNPTVADKSNIEQTIVADGAYTMEQIINF